MGKYKYRITRIEKLEKRTRRLLADEFPDHYQKWTELLTEIIEGTPRGKSLQRRLLSNYRESDFEKVGEELTTVCLQLKEEFSRLKQLGFFEEPAA